MKDVSSLVAKLERELWVLPLTQAPDNPEKVSVAPTSTLKGERLVLNVEVLIPRMAKSDLFGSSVIADVIS